MYVSVTVYRMANSGPLWLTYERDVAMRKFVLRIYGYDTPFPYYGDSSTVSTFIPDPGPSLGQWKVYLDCSDQQMLIAEWPAVPTW